jgi:hypothetical protein
MSRIDISDICLSADEPYDLLCLFPYNDALITSDENHSAADSEIQPANEDGFKTLEASEIEHPFENPLSDASGRDQERGPSKLVLEMLPRIPPEIHGTIPAGDISTEIVMRISPNMAVDLE